ncbi:hypothetical protein OAN24_02305 [Pseudodesulfovibrio sp.]|nr:hypothetical protein [Pseudodesulfovibrio sp.]
MIFVLPVFFGENESHWLKGEWWQILGNTVSLVASLDGTGFVVSNDDQVLSLASDNGLRGVRHGGPVTSDMPFPKGMAEAILAAQAECAGTPVMVLNHINPLLTVKIVQQAKDAFCRNNQRVASVVSVRDNPCQFRTCLKLMESILVNPVDPGFKPSSPYQGRVATKIIPMEWDFPCARPGAYYRRKVSLAGSTYVPVRDNDDGPLWLFETASQGRIVFSPDETMAGGYVWPRGSREFSCTLRKHENGSNQVDLVRTENASGQVVVKVASLGPKPGKVESFIMPADRQKLTMKLHDGAAHGWQIQIHEIVSDGPFDAYETFCPDDAPWKINESGRCVDAATGQVIQGRQEMPEIVDVDGSILVVEADVACISANALAEGFVPFVLDQEQSLLMATPLDIMTYRARVKAVNHAG